MQRNVKDLLLAKAGEAAERAVSSCSGYKVGAALLCPDGTVYQGCNVENPSVMLTMCAERVALLKAISEGRREFVALAVVTADGGACTPCGACRQMLIEFAPGLRIYLASKDGTSEYTIEDLLPHPFSR